MRSNRRNFELKKFGDFSRQFELCSLLSRLQQKRQVTFLKVAISRLPTLAAFTLYRGAARHKELEKETRQFENWKKAFQPVF